jgi:hypothetical protein
MAGFRVINIDVYPLGSGKPNIYPVSLFLKSFTDVQSGRVEEKMLPLKADIYFNCCR